MRAGEQAPIMGYPIFVGLNVGSEGVAFPCHTVNVQNDSDEALLNFLESHVFKPGSSSGRRRSRRSRRWRLEAAMIDVAQAGAAEQAVEVRMCGLLAATPALTIACVGRGRLPERTVARSLFSGFDAAHAWTCG